MLQGSIDISVRLTNINKRQTNQGFFFVTFFILQEVFMSDFTVTDQAVVKLKEYLEQNNISSALRIALMQGG
jgi:hypothetical protein